MIRCKNVAQLLAGDELREMKAWRRFLVKLHFLMCSHCSRLANQFEQLGSAARRLAESADHEKPAQGDDSLEARLLSKLDRD